MPKNNDKMDALINQAKKDTSNKTYKEADDLDGKSEGKKSKASSGRKKVPASHKKKARQVFYSDEDFKHIESCADILGVEPKTFMQMAINQKVKAMLAGSDDA